MKKAQDNEIVQRIIATGDKKLYAKLAGRYRNTIYFMILKMVKHQQLAEKITKQSFVLAYRQLDDFDGRQAFSNWLYSIAINHCIAFMRKHRRQKQ